MDIAGITLSQSQIWQLAGATLALAIFLLWFRRFLLRRKLFKICGVPLSSYRLKGTSLLWMGRPVKLFKHGLLGTPSTLFLKKDGRSGYVCHFNPRFFNGRVKVRERYQMLLFMGLVNEIYKLDSVKGAIQYQDHLEGIKFEPAIYNRLLDLKDEYTEAIKEWKAPNTRPLFSRELPL